MYGSEKVKVIDLTDSHIQMLIFSPYVMPVQCHVATHSSQSIVCMDLVKLKKNPRKTG